MTVRRALSMTPPVAPKMTPEPVAVPKGSSKSLLGRLGTCRPGLLEHLAELARGEPEVDVLEAGVVHLGPVALELLRRAGHERAAHDVRRVEAELLGVVGLDERAEHLLRALGRRGVGQVLGVEVLEVLDPARRAARELRQGHVLVARHERAVEPLDELGALLDDREVGGEVGVEDAVEAGAAQGGVHLEGHRRAGLEAEQLAHRRARRRGGLDDDVLGRGRRWPPTRRRSRPWRRGRRWGSG